MRNPTLGKQLIQVFVSLYPVRVQNRDDCRRPFGVTAQARSLLSVASLYEARHRREYLDPTFLSDLGRRAGQAHVTPRQADNIR